MKPVFREIDKKYIEVIGHYDNPILCAKLTLLAEIYAIEHKSGYAKFKVEDCDKLSFVNDDLEFAVTDLTGTTWLLNADPAQMTNTTHVANIHSTWTAGDYTYYSNYTLPCFDIDFTVNSDTSTYYCYGLGTKLCQTSGQGTDVSFPVTSVSSWSGHPCSSRRAASIFLNSQNTQYLSVGSDGQAYANVFYYWTNDPTITITGGSDVTNSDLITWLEENGTLIIPVSSNDYAITHILKNLTHGNITLQITPDSGYTYPSNITITNGTLVSYDSSTGIAVINGDDTTSINCECVEITGYSGNIIASTYAFLGGGETYIKFGSAPSSNSDYDAYVNTSGALAGATTYTNQTKAYIWSSLYSGGVRINETVTNCNYTSYSNAIEIILTSNYDIELLYQFSSSGGAGN